MKKTDPKAQVAIAVAACEEKKADRITILQLDKAAGGFTDFFVISSGSNPRQVQAICDEVEQRLSSAGLRPSHIEGYKSAEWVLLDYVDFVVHVFSEKARKFYDLERLWKSARRLATLEVKAKTRKRASTSPRGSSPARPRSRVRKTTTN
jgi:ribosome-associated protein